MDEICVCLLYISKQFNAELDKKKIEFFVERERERNFFSKTWVKCVCVCSKVEKGLEVAVVFAYVCLLIMMNVFVTSFLLVLFCCCCCFVVVRCFLFL